MSHRLHPLAVPFLVKPPRGVRVRSRLRVSDRDALVLWALGLYLGGLDNNDLALRCARGTAGGDGRTERKRALTKEASSRWAGAITRTSNDQWERGWRNRRDQQLGLQRAIRSIETRLALPVGERGGHSRGYASQAERFQKQRRLQMLKGRLAQLEARLGAGRVSVTRGGRELARLRHHLEPAGLSEARWRERWEAERLFLTADGEADKYLGNETMRWHPEQQWLEIKLPGRLAFLANRPHGRYRLDCQVSFRHRGSEVASQAMGGAIRYDISYQPERGRWYLDASPGVPREIEDFVGWGWRLPAGPLPELKGVLSAGVLGVDLNAGHLAAWVVDRAGNPRSRPRTLPLVLEGLRASRRDGRLRAAISALVGLARQAGVKAIAIEDLDFRDARQPTPRNLRFRGDPGVGRETMGRGQRGKRWRRSVAGLPTAKFHDRLVQMCTNAGLRVVAVDPAYSSKWGEAHWRAPLDKQTKASISVSRHQAAAVVIGRRSLGHRARRRPDVTDAHPGVPTKSQISWGGTGGWVAESYRSGLARAQAAQDPGRPRRRLRTPGGGKTQAGRRSAAGAQVTEDRSRWPGGLSQMSAVEERLGDPQPLRAGIIDRAGTNKTGEPPDQHRRDSCRPSRAAG